MRRGFGRSSHDLHQASCRVVCLTDLNTHSEYRRRFREAAIYDLDLCKPIHGFRLCKLQETMTELQASPFQHQHSHLVGITINELPTAESEITFTAAPAQVTQGPPMVRGDKLLDGMHVLLVEDTMVLEPIQKKMLTNLGATVEIAANGSKAVATFTKAPEDASGVSYSQSKVLTCTRLHPRELW